MQQNDELSIYLFIYLLNLWINVQLESTLSEGTGQIGLPINKKVTTMATKLNFQDPSHPTFDTSKQKNILSGPRDLHYISGPIK